jgi:hypothetical protein
MAMSSGSTLNVAEFLWELYRSPNVVFVILFRAPVQDYAGPFEKKKKKFAFRVFKDFLFLNRGELFFLSRLKTTSLLFYSVAKIESCCCWKLLLQCSRDPLK